jgi:addiction module RelE/StbE family toxin
MAKISWTKWSVKDLRLIYDYISIDSPFYANRFISKIISRVEQLESMPLSGRIVPEKEDPNIRELIEGNYRIFYKVSRNNISILRIHNSARNLK